MRKIELQVDLFGDRNPRIRALSEAAMAHFLEGLTLADQIYLIRHPDAPHPYRSGVRYRREHIGQEDWKSIGPLLRDGFGDCEDLGAYLAAWKREREGIAAKAQALPPVAHQGALVYHIGVRSPQGWEDPSRVLGMGSVT